MEPIIQAINVTRKFQVTNAKNKKSELIAVENLNLEIPKGEIFGLVGPDGAGKTTTLRLFCGLLDPTEGQVRVAGFDASRETDQVRDRIGYMAQRFGQIGRAHV